MSAIGRHNLALLSESAFERHGDYPTLLFEGRWHGSGELRERSLRISGGLQAIGLAPGQRVVVTMDNSPDVGVVYRALWHAGAVVTPAMFLLPPRELRHVLADAEATAVVTTPEFLAKVAEAAAGVESVRFLVSTGDGDQGAVSLASLQRSEPGTLVPRADHDLAALMYTGGTTGRAKGVMLSHDNLWVAGKAGQEARQERGLTRGLFTLPLSHSYGLMLTVGAMHSEERTRAVLLRRFDPVAFLELVQEHALQLSAVVPSMLQQLLSSPLEEYDLSSLRYLGCGAAPLAPEVVEELRRRVPWVDVRQGYGLTETAALVSTNPPGRAKDGSVGLPVPGTEVRIVDDAGRELPPGEVGEICCRSRSVMAGYWRSPEATAEAVRDGWLHTGDMGYLDEEGYLFIVDRKKDVIIRGGFNVFPRDVEDVLLEHPAVEAAGVVGRSDESRGEEVVAFVSLRPGARAASAELIDFVRERVARYKYPRELHVVDAVPLTAVGKVDRRALRARLDRS